MANTKKLMVTQVTLWASVEDVGSAGETIFAIVERVTGPKGNSIDRIVKGLRNCSSWTAAAAELNAFKKVAK